MVKGAYYGIRVPGLKYVEYTNGEIELYDLTNDPYEVQNQANQPVYQAKQNELARLLHGYLK